MNRLVDYSDSSEEEEQEEINYEIIERESRISRKFKTTSKVYDLLIKSGKKYTPEVFDTIVEDLKRLGRVNDRDKVRFSITHPTLSYGIHIPFETAGNVSGDNILSEIEKVAQSNESFKFEDKGLKLEMTHTKMPDGSGRKYPRGLKSWGLMNAKDLSTLKRCITRIENPNDSMCLARAISVGIVSVSKHNTPEWKALWKRIKNPSGKYQTDKAIELTTKWGISETSGCGVEEFKIISSHLQPRFSLKVWSQHGELIFKPEQITGKTIHIYNYDNHYDYITSICGFKGRSYYCEHCDIFYSTIGKHRCVHICDCYSNTICERELHVRCEDCLRTFRSPACYDNHKQLRQTTNICSSVYLCKACNQTVVATNKSHVCAGTRQCKYCKEIVGEDHDCYIPSYDFETLGGKCTYSMILNVNFSMTENIFQIFAWLIESVIPANVNL